MRYSARATVIAATLAAAQVAAAGQTLPATCAALWHAYADLLGDADARTLAERFAAVARRLDGTAAASVIGDPRPDLAQTLNAAILLQDRQSRDVFEAMAADCHVFGAEHPETAPLLTGQ